MMNQIEKSLDNEDVSLEIFRERLTNVAEHIYTLTEELLKINSKGGIPKMECSYISVINDKQNEIKNELIVIIFEAKSKGINFDIPDFTDNPFYIFFGNIVNTVCNKFDGHILGSITEEVFYMQFNSIYIFEKALEIILTSKQLSEKMHLTRASAVDILGGEPIA